MKTPRSLLLLVALSGTAALTCPSAWAGEVEEAEHQRLYEEMKRLSSRSAWAGVERAFLNLEELKGEEPTFDDLYLGALAARNLGKIGACKDRLDRASGLESNAEVEAMLAEITANYGAVSLSADKDAPDVSLTPSAMPFAADQRQSIERAQKILLEERSFEDLLPRGEYTFGDQRFTVEVGGETEVALKFQQERDLSLSVGPKLDLGLAFTSAGEPAEGSPPQPSAFSGAGPRLAAGVELGFGSTLGIWAQAGYHSLFGGADPDAPEGFSGYSDRMHLGFAALGPSARFGDLWLSGGGILGLGVSQATGVGACSGGSNPECTVLQGINEEYLDYIPWQGSIQTPGAQAQVGYALFDLGGLQGALSLTGGALFDPYRTYPWGQLAFALVPARSN